MRSACSRRDIVDTWGILTDTHEDGKEVVFEGVNGMLGSVAVMHVRGYELVRHLPLLLDDAFALHANLITKDLEINLVDTNGRMMHDSIVGSNVILVLLGLERADEDGIGITVVGSHDVLNGKTTSVASVELEDGLHPNLGSLVLGRRAHF